MEVLSLHYRHCESGVDLEVLGHEGVDIGGAPLLALPVVLFLQFLQLLNFLAPRSELSQERLVLDPPEQLLLLRLEELQRSVGLRAGVLAVRHEPAVELCEGIPQVLSGGRYCFLGFSGRLGFRVLQQLLPLLAHTLKVRLGRHSGLLHCFTCFLRWQRISTHNTSTIYALGAS